MNELIPDHDCPMCEHTGLVYNSEIYCINPKCPVSDADGIAFMEVIKNRAAIPMADSGHNAGIH